MTVSAPHRGPVDGRPSRSARSVARTRRRTGRTAWTALGSAALLAVAGTGLVGCGAEEAPEEPAGLAAKAAGTVEEEARVAAEEAESMRLSGSVVVGDAAFRLDMRVGPDGAVGEVSTDGMRFELLRDGEDLYLKADAGFWQLQQPDDAESDPDVDPAESLEGRYVVVAPDDPAYEQLGGFTDKAALLDGLLALEGDREKGELGEVDGVETLEITADGGSGGRLEVALTEPHYPMLLERGGEAGEVRMGHWDEEFTVRPPEDDQIVDYGDDLMTSVDGDG